MYVCQECKPVKSYKLASNFKKHRMVKHAKDVPESISVNDTSLVKSFMNLTLLMHDTWDAYKMGDGDRIFRNAKLEMLMFGNTSHPKYKLGLFRMLLTEHILSPAAAYEYRWNSTSNIIGGIGNNLPNDNLVEVTVKKVKRLIHSQGANVTHSSARNAALACQVVDTIKATILEKHRRSNKKSDKSVDIELMADVLLNSAYFEGHSKCFSNYRDPIERTDVNALDKWMVEKKKNYVKLYSFDN